MIVIVGSIVLLVAVIVGFMATGNTRPRTEGRVDQFKGNTNQAGAKVQDAFKH